MSESPTASQTGNQSASQAPSPTAGDAASALLLERARQAVELARAAGADDAWATAVERRTVGYRYRDGKPETVTDATTRALTLRLYVGGRYGVFSSTDLREPQLRAFIREAVPLTRQLQADPHRRITPPALFPSADPPDLELVDERIGTLDGAQRLAWCRELEALVRAEPRLISATSNVIDTWERTAAASSNGFSRAYGRTAVSLSLNLSLRDSGTGGDSGTGKDPGERRAEDGDGAVCLHLADLPSPEVIAEQALARTRARLGSRQGPTTKGTLLVEARAASRLVGNGILVTDWAGGNADPTTGEFSQGLNGHVIRNGEVAEPVFGMIVTGSLPRLFASLTELGNDPYPYDSLLTPSLVFENVQFSGA